MSAASACGGSARGGEGMGEDERSNAKFEQNSHFYHDHWRIQQHHPMELRRAATSNTTEIGSPPPPRLELRHAATTANGRDPVKKIPTFSKKSMGTRGRGRRAAREGESARDATEGESGDVACQEMAWGGGGAASGGGRRRRERWRASRVSRGKDVGETSGRFSQNIRCDT